MSNEFKCVAGGRPVSVPLPGGDLTLQEAAIPVALADRWLAELTAEIGWEQEVLRIFGREVKVPRQVAWHGDAGRTYRYSGVVHEPRPWTALLREIKRTVERLAGARFNSVLANRYRDGADSMGWHSDDEPELGPEPVIASLSLGASRKLRFRHRQRCEPARQLTLDHGSLLVMRGATQTNWQHALPKTRRPVGPRINLTFRRIISPHEA